MGHGSLRMSPSDFRVEEIAGFDADGEGPHWLMRVEKRERTTNDMARQLARLAGVRERDIGYAGMKDRDAVTRQWFTVPVTDSEPEGWSLEGGRILCCERHRRKLRRGALAGNRFRIVLRDCDGEVQLLEQRLAAVATRGVPNYFGPQRFGRDGDNVHRLLHRPLPRRGNLRGLLLSAGRAWIFNQVLAQRVEREDWDRPIDGDVMMLAGSRSRFLSTPGDPELADRCRRGDIHPTGPLWGADDTPARGQAARIEQQVVKEHAPVADRLTGHNMEQDRRALRMPVSELEWTWRGQDLQLDFRLPPGGFATTVVRELITDREARSQHHD